MKIKEVRIYGYGKLENVVIRIDDDLTVLFGENEAGKSTIMSFVHSVLFGFPTRQQTELLRYEPKFHSKYGGMLVVDLPDVGVVTIERVKGKATGDVTVILPNGKIGGEELLTEVLHGMDRNTFRSIYSFSMHDIQNIQQVSNDDLNRFLFSSSAVGTDRLMKIEAELQKELDARFKRRGQNPTLNVMLTDIREAEKELLKAKRENDTYFLLIQEQAQLKKRQVELKEEEQQVRDHIRIIEDWQRMQPLLLQQAEIEAELADIGEITFPIDGQNQIKQIQQLLLPVETQIVGKKERLQLVQKEIEENEPKQSILEHEAEILWVSETLSLYERLKHDEMEQQKNLAHVNEEIALVRDTYHLQIEQNKLVQVNTGMAVKDEVATIDRELSQLQIKTQEVTERIEERNRTVLLLEKEQAEIADEMLTVEHRQVLEEQVDAEENRERLQRQYDETAARLMFLRNGQQQAKAKERVVERKHRLETVFLVVILLTVAVLSIVNEQMIIGMATFVGIAFLLWMRRSSVTTEESNHLEQEIEVSEKSAQSLAGQLEKVAAINVTEIETALARDNQLRERHTHVRMRLKQLHEDVEADEVVLAKHDEDEQLLQRACLQYAKEWGVATETVCTHLLTVFQALEQLKKLYRTSEQVVLEGKTTTDKVQEIEERVFQLGEICQVDSETSIYQMAAQLKRLREEALAKDIVFKEKQVKQSELVNELRQLDAEHQELLAREAGLYREARVTDFEQFYAIGEQAERQKQLNEQLLETARHIDLATIERAKEMWTDLSARGTEESEACTTKLASIHLFVEETQQALAEVRHKISLLEEGGTYADLLHRYKLKQAALNDEAKEWARYALAKDLLTKTMDKYQEEKLPKVLMRAGEYLSELTDGAYVSIFMQAEKGFTVERNDYVHFDPKELSQATAEQVYVALRLALATTLGEQSQRYSIMIDDSFVNFDEKRVRRTIALLQRISKEYQILFFTCHTHIRTLFQKEQFIELEAKTAGNSQTFAQKATNI